MSPFPRWGAGLRGEQKGVARESTDAVNPTSTLTYTGRTPQNPLMSRLSRDGTIQRAPLTNRQAQELIDDETCPGRCEWEDVDVVELPKSPARKTAPVKLLQTCANCDWERYVPPPDHPDHARVVEMLDSRVNAIPKMLRTWGRG